MIDFTPLSGAECPADLNTLLSAFAMHLNLPPGINNMIFQEGTPDPDGNTLWYKPSTNTLNVYVNGGWKAISGGIWKIGDIIMFDSVVDTDITLASQAHPTRQPWAICDGNTYSGIATPNLVDRFARGSTSGFGTTGGADSAVLTVAQIPSHRHGIGTTSASAGSGALTDTMNGSDIVQSLYACGHGTTFGSEEPVDPTAAADPVATLPKYAVLGFKKYIGFP